MEKEIQQRLVLLEQLRNEAEGIQRRIVEMELMKNELQRTIESLEFFQNLENDVEALMNLGGGVFAYVNVNESKKMLVDIGAGVVVEREVGEAIEYLKSKRVRVEESSKKLQEVLNQIASQMERLQAEIAKLSKEAEKREEKK